MFPPVKSVKRALTTRHFITNPGPDHAFRSKTQRKTSHYAKVACEHQRSQATLKNRSNNIPLVFGNFLPKTKRI
jgi:hypothetical protein